MSFFEDASLVLIPSGYKASKVYSVKPTDGTGDLTFTRALDTATRVGPDGLIEKVRTNVALQSENQTGWTDQDQTLVTANAAANPLNGAVTADKVIPTALLGDHFRGLNMATMNGEITASIFVKADGYNFFDFGIWNATAANYPVRATFDLSTQTFTLTNGSIASITAAGSGYFRISITGSVASASSITIYHRVRPTGGTGNYSGDGTSGMLLWGCQLESGVMTPYIGPTTTAAVSVGMLANVPRLDYTGGGCPKLLLEPQRTNLLNFSEQFNNASYFDIGAAASVSANTNETLDPAGFNGADKLTANGSGAIFVRNNVYAGTAQTCSNSIFAKKANHPLVGLRNSGTTSSHDVFNFDTKTWTNNSGATLSYDELGNGWFRLKSTNTDPVNLNYYWSVIPAVTTAGAESATASNLSVYIFGGQAEQNAAYPTSYIPTLGAAVTRGADAATTASVPSLIGQTEGVLFIEYNRTNTFEGAFFMLSNLVGTTANAYHNSFYFLQQANGTMVVEVYVAAAPQVLFTIAALSVGTHKIAFAYKANDFALYIDGVQLGTDTSGSVPTANFLSIGGAVDGGSQKQSVTEALLFKTRLTNAQLAELTA